MTSRLIFDPALSADDLRGFSSTIAQIEWLSISLVLLYLGVTQPPPEVGLPIVFGAVAFTAFVVTFHYTKFRRETHWKIAIETWVMIGFFTWVLAYSGGLESPLANLYLLVVITTALTLTKLATTLQMTLIAICYLWLGNVLYVEAVLPRLAQIGAQFAPVILVAYVTTILSTEIRRAMTHIKSLAVTDELTGLFNLRAFMKEAEQTARRAVRYDRPYSVLMIDADGLKEINDNYGHDFGNGLIKDLAKGIQVDLRDTDVIARYGGDEFIVLLPETRAVPAGVLASRIRERVEAAQLAMGDALARCTVTIGVAGYPEHGNDLKAIIAAADRALSAGKRLGSNRITMAARSQPSSSELPSQSTPTHHAHSAFG